MSNTHADKRTVNTDALETLGMIIGPNEKRDAIHLAVEPVVASHWMNPGDHVRFVHGSKLSVEVVDRKDAIGMVDPFLHGEVEKGERFWLVVYPREITSLRHVWTHPAFEEEADEPAKKSSLEDRLEFKKELDGTNAARRWIESYADSVGLGYDELMDAAEDWITSSHESTWGGEYLNRGELLDGVSLPSEFWIHYQKFTGKTVEPKYQQNFFTCSC